MARLGLLAGGLVAGLLVAEGTLRMAGYSPSHVNPWGALHRSHPEIGYLGKPDLESRWAGSDFDIRVRHDADGFRRPEHQNRDAAHDLYVLGDSFTWGWGVDQGETFSDLLSLRLPAFRVHNFGVIGFGTAGQNAIFESFVAPRLAPGDLVLLAFYANDFNDNVGGHTAAVIESDGRVVYRPESRPFSSRWIDRSYLFNLVAYRWNYAREARNIRRLQQEIENLGSVRQEAKALPDDVPRMVITRHYLEAMGAATAAAGARFVVAYITDPWEYDPDVRQDHPWLAANRVAHHSFARLAEQLDLDTIDLLPAFQRARREGDDPPLVYGPHDLHWTPRGHVVAADAIASKLAGVGGDGS